MTNSEEQTGAAAAADPMATLIAELRGNQKGRADARKAASQIAQAGRPWEQLPPALRRALRDDARQILGKGKDGEGLVKAGYGSGLSRQLLRDLGLA